MPHDPTCSTNQPEALRDNRQTTDSQKVPLTRASSSPSEASREVKLPTELNEIKKKEDKGFLNSGLSYVFTDVPPTKFLPANHCPDSQMAVY
ncbi:hypothetical protein Q5P01_016739 [Channa striata]|uniref:Uncharacterized protein n=1 Tax=Channa striata TaxID=64152 RepID=A0AA88SC04_CHASR|nr:hypothetical protein Q5P01_016739 [Channa striata]